MEEKNDNLASDIKAHRIRVKMEGRYLDYHEKRDLFSHNSDPTDSLYNSNSPIYEEQLLYFEQNTNKTSQ